MTACNDLDTHAEQSDERMDIVFDVLAHPYRQTIVRTLDREAPMSLAELAERLYEARELASVQRAKVALVHHHLPRMEDAGVVDYDADERRCDLAAGPTVRAVVTLARERSTGAEARTDD